MNALFKTSQTYGGPFLVALSIGIIELMAWQGVRFPNPSVILLPLTMVATLAGGLGSGLAAALLSTVYYVYINHVPGGIWLGAMSPQGWTAIAATTLVVPLTELFRRQLLGQFDERFRTLADNIAELAWMADEKGEIIWLNQRSYDLTGCTFDDLKGWQWLKLVRSDQREAVEAKRIQAIQTGDMWEDVFALRTRDGSYHWFLSRGVPLRDKQGRVKRWFGTGTDVTMQLEVEQQLLKLKERLEEQVAERSAVAEGRAGQLRALAVELTEAEQRERARLARVLHDDLQQLLVAAKMQLSMGSPATNGGGGNIGSVEELLSQAIESARSLSRELAPAVLHEKGLGAAIEWLAQRARERYGLNVEVESRDPGDEEEWLKVFLFDVVRELLLNVVKHADTDRVKITFDKDHDEVELVVEDFGKGFEVEAARQRGQETGFGLFFVQRRVALIGGKVVVESEPGRGTCVCISVPLGGARQSAFSPSS